MVAGNLNAACDYSSIVGGGYDNVIGGDGSADFAGIFAGENNAIEGGGVAGNTTDEFMGGGGRTCAVTRFRQNLRLWPATEIRTPSVIR